MVKENHFITKLPETYTVSYYNPEVGENVELSQEQLRTITNPSEIRVINKGEVYRSWKDAVDNALYGPSPMEFVGFAGSDNVIDKLREKFPKVASLVEYNRNGTAYFLRSQGVLSVYKVDGLPELSIFDSDGLERLERMIISRGIEEVKRYIDRQNS